MKLSGMRGVVVVCLVLCLCGAAKIDNELKYYIEIPQLSVDEALNTLAQQTGVRLLFPYDLVKGLDANPVSGRYTLKEVLELLLRDTGLSSGLTVSGIVTISRAQSNVNEAEKMIKKETQKPFLTAVSAAFLSALTPTTVTGAEEEDSISALEEITVTARRRDESLMDTPVSITAFSSKDLENRMIVQAHQIAESTPNVVYMNNAMSSNTASIVYIRGIGQGDFAPSVQPGVGIYVDDAYIAASIGSLSEILDIESVQVLRGPQGTLFGRNTIGGAILINSKKPNETFAGEVEVQVGENDYNQLRGLVNIPLTDNLFAKFSTMYRKKDGWVDAPNVSGDDGFGNEDTQASRIALRWLPTESVTVDFYGNYVERESDGFPNTMVILDDSPNTEIGRYNNEMAPVLGLGLITPELYLPPRGKAVNYSEFAPGSEVESYSTGLTVAWDISENLRVKSITSYRDMESIDGHDQDFSPERAMWLTDIIDSQQFTQEFQFSGSAMNDRLKWTLGAYYFEENTDNVNPILFSRFSFVSGSIVDNKSTAAFGQFTYDVTDKFAITLGGRYTDEQLDSIVTDRIQYVTELYDPTCVGACAAFPDSNGLDRYARRGGQDGYVSFPAPPDPGAFNIQPNRVFEADHTDFEPFLNLTYRWNDSWMTYATYSEGFKGGGFTQRIPPGRTVQSFEPEQAKAYELGAKYQSEDGRYRVTGSVFYTDYTDLQVTVATELGGGIENASDSEIKGFELEATGAVTENLTLSFGAGYLDAQYKDVRPEVTFSASNDLPATPPWQLNASASYRVQLAGGSVTARLDYSYMDDFYGGARNEIITDSYEVFNGAITYTPESEKWELAIQARNLFDEFYAISRRGNTGAGIFQQVVAPPREALVRFKYKFGE